MRSLLFYIPCCGHSVDDDPRSQDCLTTCLDERGPLLRLHDSDRLKLRGLDPGKYSYLILSACDDTLG